MRPSGNMERRGPAQVAGANEGQICVQDSPRFVAASLQNYSLDLVSSCADVSPWRAQLFATSFFFMLDDGDYFVISPIFGDHIRRGCIPVGPVAGASIRVVLHQETGHPGVAI